MTATLEMLWPAPGCPAGALHPIRGLARPGAAGAEVEVLVDGRPVSATLRRQGDALAISSWCDTRGLPPGLHAVRVTVRMPDGREAVDERLLRVGVGEVPDQPPAPRVPDGVPLPRQVRIDDPGLGDALTETAAGGPPLAILAVGSSLAPGAPEWIATTFADGTVDVAVGDEATPVGGLWVRRRVPAFQPEALPCLDQVGCLLVVGPRAATALVDAPPSGIYGLAMELVDRRLTSLAARRVLTLSPEARVPVDDDAGRAAVRRLAARRRRDVRIEPGAQTGLRDVRWPVATPAAVVAVIPSCTPSLAAACLNGLAECTHHPDLRAVLVASGPHQEELRQVAAGAALPVTAVSYPVGEPFNYQRAVNLGAAAAPPGADVLFLNDDVVPLRPDWLERMVELLSLPAVGFTGAFLRTPDGRIQHAGVMLSPGPGHLGHDAPRDAPGDFFSFLVPGNPIAVTGACVLFRRELLDELEGHDEQYTQLLGDIDICLRARELGWRGAWCAQALLEHAESATYGDRMDEQDHEYFTRRWPTAPADAAQGIT